MKKLVLRIRFGRSRSKYFRDAVKLAAQIPGYKRRDEERREFHQLDLELDLTDLQHWDEITNLTSIISGWKSTTITTDDLGFRSHWELQARVGEVIYCRHHLLRRGDPDCYCSGKLMPGDDPIFFGCRLMTKISCGFERPSRNTFGWYQFGEFVGGAQLWKIDKNKILCVIERFVESSIIKYCPDFSWDRTKNDINFLPDYVDTSGGQFEVEYSKLNPDRPIGVIPRLPPSYVRIPVNIVFPDGDEMDGLRCGSPDIDIDPMYSHLAKEVDDEDEIN